jgi:hypothetical protein
LCVLNSLGGLVYFEIRVRSLVRSKSPRVLCNFRIIRSLVCFQVCEDSSVFVTSVRPYSSKHLYGLTPANMHRERGCAASSPLPLPAPLTQFLYSLTG